MNNAPEAVLCRGLSNEQIGAIARRGRVRGELGMPAPFPVRCEPMENERLAFLDAKPGAPPQFGPRYAAARTKLMEGLVAVGGERALVPAIEEDVAKLLARGVLYDGKGAGMARGEASRCHSNSSELWLVNRDHALLMTGYALSDDGLWRQHSWVVDVRPRSVRVYETTEHRVAYFGYPMNEAEAAAFYDANSDFPYPDEVPTEAPTPPTPDDEAVACPATRSR